MSYNLNDFDFDFDENLIALRPANPRGDAGMLVWQGQDRAITDARVADLPDFLRDDDLLVFNDTKVIPARLEGERRRDFGQGMVGAKVSVTLLKPDTEGRWQVMLKPARKVETGDRIVFGDGFSASVVGKTATDALLHLETDGMTLDEALKTYGAMPLPPYIERLRAPDEADKRDYQPVFARHKGAVAAPTASLHFDDALLSALSARGIAHEFVTLHVGAGTFLPVKVDDIETHKMHAEYGEISADTARRLNAHRKNGGRVIAVGTTALRLLESAADARGIHPFAGDTDIFIRPGFRFHGVDGLITNFHLPKSTLLMLVAALTGYGQMREIYTHAVNKPYRFFSYGDMSLLLP